MKYHHHIFIPQANIQALFAAVILQDVIKAKHQYIDEFDTVNLSTTIEELSYPLARTAQSLHADLDNNDTEICNVLWFIGLSLTSQFMQGMRHFFNHIRVVAPLESSDRSTIVRNYTTYYPDEKIALLAALRMFTDIELHLHNVTKRDFGFKISYSDAVFNPYMRAILSSYKLYSNNGEEKSFITDILPGIDDPAVRERERKTAAINANLLTGIKHKISMAWPNMDDRILAVRQLLELDPSFKEGGKDYNEIYDTGERIMNVTRSIVTEATSSNYIFDVVMPTNISLYVAATFTTSKNYVTDVCERLMDINKVCVAACVRLVPGGKYAVDMRSVLGTGYALAIAKLYNGGGHADAAGFTISIHDFFEKFIKPSKTVVH